MQFRALVFASVATLAVAQTATSSAASSGATCAAQNILDACLSTEQARVTSCTGNDWDCLCAAYGDVLTCYNNCPEDPKASSAQQQRDQYCAAASAYGTKTASATGSTAASTVAAVSVTSTAVSATSASHTSSTAAATSASHNSATGLQVSSGMIAVILAGLGLMA